MTFDDFKSLCESRRSVRYFDDNPVTKEEILQLIEIACLAPSVENLQPWHFHVIVDKKLRHRLMDSSCYGNFVAGAGAFIVVTVNRTMENAAKEPLWNERELDYSCMAAMTNILNGATAMGLGSCWVSLHHGKAHEVLKLPRYEVIVGGLMVGHFHRGEEHASDGRQRKPLADTYTFHE